METPTVGLHLNFPGQVTELSEWIPDLFLRESLTSFVAASSVGDSTAVCYAPEKCDKNRACPESVGGQAEG